mmetsp:Transcript_9635/g.14504  ORF Transcript_9635/g.14504 Transcript_9635/m.14504 type:complete len:638 (-) Transcript_9635:41-1954(-)
MRLLLCLVLIIAIVSQSFGLSTEDEMIDDEISSLDELIRLQQMKLDRLRESRRKMQTSKLGESVSEVPYDGESNHGAEYSTMAHPNSGHNSRDKDIEVFPSYHPDGMMNYLVERMNIQTNYTIAATHLMTTKAARSPSSKPITVTLVIAIDTSGTLHIYSLHGEEIVQHDLSQYHGGSKIVASDVEGDGEVGPVIGTGSLDGTIHVLAMTVTSEEESSAATHGFGVTVRSVETFTIASPEAPAHATAMHLYYRGSQRGLGIYIGDSMCRFSGFSYNGTLLGRTGVSGEREGIHTGCTPRERGGIGRMTRIGQIMAVPVGHAVVMLHIARLYVPPRICLGGSERIVQATIDLKSMTYVLAKTESGSLLTFNTKVQSGRNNEYHCELTRVQTAQKLTHRGEEAEYLSALQNPNTLVSLRGAMITASGCTMTLFNTSELKRSRTAAMVIASEVPGECSNISGFNTMVSSMWLDVTPRYLRDFTNRGPVEVYVSTAFNNAPAVIDEECHGGQGNDSAIVCQANIQAAVPDSGHILVYLSLLKSMDEPDEMEWIKWPLTIGGVLIFLMFKYFNSTSSSKRSKSNFSARYKGMKGRENSSSSPPSTAELQKELERLNTMTTNLQQMSSSLESKANGLSKKKWH